MTIEQLKSEALKLPHHERARLAQELIESLDEDSEIERAWYKEAERRLLEIREGRVETVSGEDVLASARARLKGT
jgi:putative addiction module component (TIGR02574 family)